MDDADAWQLGQVVFGDAGELVAGVAGGEEGAEFGGLAFGPRFRASVKLQARRGVSWRRLLRMLGVLDVVMEPPFR